MGGKGGHRSGMDAGERVEALAVRACRHGGTEVEARLPPPLARALDRRP